MRDFRLTIDALREVRRDFRNRVQEGLARTDREIKALPAYLPPPTGQANGDVLVLDLGGTNMRAALVNLAGGRAKIESQEQKSIRREYHSADEFFDEQAGLLLALEPPDGLRLGYCFSFPAEVTPDRDARLLRWTKEVNIPAVVGTCVGEGLSRALARQSYTSASVAVLNDTVASLIAGSARYGNGGSGTRRTLPYTDFIGLVVGTGTNMAAFMKAERVLRKMPPSDSSWWGPIAVNLESGAFEPDPSHLTEWDESVNQGSGDPGKQRFEKAVAGAYLPKLFAAACPDFPEPPPSSKELFALAAANSSDPQRIARDIVDRSADLVAATLAGLIDVLTDVERVGILAEGSVFCGDQGQYQARVRETLSLLLHDDPEEPDRHKIHTMDDANLIGAAYAAFSR